MYAHTSTLLEIPIGLLMAVCSVESDHRDVINPKDGGEASYGRCQVQLSTAKRVWSSITPSELMVPYKNVLIAAATLRRHYERLCSKKAKWCKWEYAVAAYNRGSLKLNGDTPINHRYVDKVWKQYKAYKDVFNPSRSKGRAFGKTH